MANYVGGEHVGASWTDKVMHVKGQEDKALPQDQVGGVDEDEWVGGINLYIEFKQVREQPVDLPGDGVVVGWFCK